MSSLGAGIADLSGWYALTGAFCCVRGRLRLRVWLDPPADAASATRAADPVVVGPLGHAAPPTFDATALVALPPPPLLRNDAEAAEAARSIAPSHVRRAKG